MLIDDWVSFGFGPPFLLLLVLVKVTLKPPERKESYINVSTRLLGDLARARYGLDEVVWVYELPLLLLPTIHPLI